MKIKYTYVVLLLISFISFCISIYNYIDNKQEVKKYLSVQNDVIKAENNLVKKLQTKYNNKEIIGYFEIKNINIKDILVQTNNNKYYLNHLVNKEYNSYGSVFVDYRNDLLNDKKINVYGHTSKKNNTTFSNLKKYLKKDYFNKNNIIELTNISNKEIYKIFSVQIVDNSNHMKIKYNNKEWNNYLNNLKDNSIYYKNIDNIKDKKIITFQTCIYLEKKKFLLINAVRI